MSDKMNYEMKLNYLDSEIHEVLWDMDTTKEILEVLSSDALRAKFQGRLDRKALELRELQAMKVSLMSDRFHKLYGKSRLLN